MQIYQSLFRKANKKIDFLCMSLKKNSTFVNVSIKNNKYGSDSIDEYTERR
jgi:hypothetical protein